MCNAQPNDGAGNAGHSESVLMAVACMSPLRLKPELCNKAPQVQTNLVPACECGCTSVYPQMSGDQPEAGYASRDVDLFRLRMVEEGELRVRERYAH